MAKKSESSVNKGKLSSNDCPTGSHYVRKHSMHIPPSKKHPKGLVVIRHAHCRKNIRSSQKVQDDYVNCLQLPITVISSNGDDANDIYSKIPDMVKAVSSAPNTEIIKQLDSKLLKEYGVNTSARLSAFLGQIAKETNGFRTLVENISDKAASNYKGGAKYKGRGLIQLTGEDNYRYYGKSIDVDLVNNPELAADPRYSLLIAIKFWKDIDGNKLSDMGNIDEITYRIQGRKAPADSRAQRKAYFDKMEKILEENE